MLCNSTRPDQHTLQKFADHCDPIRTIPWETYQGLLQPQGELYPIQTIFNHRSQDQLLEFHTSFYGQLAVKFVQGNFKHTQFPQEHWFWRDSNSQPLALKASAVSIELTWVLELHQWLNKLTTTYLVLRSTTLLHFWHILWSTNASGVNIIVCCGFFPK